ncbi:hypothetical protein [Sulfurimonas sp.]|uniref:hypothetical protein n=1 Tax=Sulfurimonas sp. TaxID=2022749 RepID=UPI003562B85C
MKFIYIVLLIYICANASSLSSDGGRYVFGNVNGKVRADTYMLDTKTGELWQIIQTKDGYNQMQKIMYECYFFNNIEKKQDMFLSESPGNCEKERSMIMSSQKKNKTQ